MSFKHMLQVGVTTSLHLPVRSVNFRSIKVHIEPADIDLYERLLPAPLRMPARPMVFLELSQASPTWHEGILSIACRHGDTEGWHGLYWAIDSYYPCEFGRLVGYPKFMAQKMSLEETGGRWLGEVEHDGKSHLRINFCPDPDAADAVAEADLRSIEGERPWLLQVPPEKGPYINRMTYTEFAGPQPVCTPGAARVNFSGDQRFQGLLPDGGATGPAQLVEKSGNCFGILRSLRMRSSKSPAEGETGK